VDGWLPHGERTRTVFVVVVLLLCSVLALVRWAVLPALFATPSTDVSEVAAELIGDFIATALAGTVLALILQRLFPGPNKPPVVENVPAHEISSRLESTLPTTRRWWYDGSTGGYQRSVTMPELARLARRSGVSRESTIVILDPTDEDLCRRYGGYRTGVNKMSEVYSVDRVRIDIYATILAALDFNGREPLNVAVALKSTLSILRYDLSDDQLVITKEGKTDPAIACPANSFYYDAFFEQLKVSRKQAKELELSKATVPPGGFDRESARNAFTQLEIATKSLDHDSILDAIIEKSLSRKSPYS
jgi:hypothetical protein